MPFLINCTGCKRKLRIQDHLLGKNIKCPGCGFKLLAKPTETAAPAPVPAPPAPAIPTPALTPGGALKEAQTTIAPPPLSAPSNEEPLEVLDPIVLDEPSTDSRGDAVTAAAPPPLESDDELPRIPEPTLPPRARGSPVRVFALLTGLLLATILLGLIGGWWISRSIDNQRAKTQLSR